MTDPTHIYAFRIARSGAAMTIRGKNSVTNEAIKVTNVTRVDVEMTAPRDGYQQNVVLAAHTRDGERFILHARLGS